MTKIIKFTVDDVRFPTSKDLIGSDAIHTDPDYSATYVTVYTSDNNLKGFGIAFTIGKGNDIVAECIKHFFPLFVSKTIDEIPEKICCAALDMLSAITLDRSSTKEVIDNWEIKCWYFTDKPRNYSINFSRFLDVNDTTYHYGNLSLMIKNTSAYEKCYFGWSVDAANGVWKDGYTPNVDWR